MTLSLKIISLYVILTLVPVGGSVINPPTSKTWSNRLGTTLTPITTGVWAAERPFIWNKIDVGGRSVICRVSDGTLLVHSPVEWTEDLALCLDKLGGGVGHVVSPNYEHLKYAKQWSEKYPLAKMYACPGLPARLPEISWNVEIGSEPPIEFGGSVDSVHFDCEVNPVTNKPFFNEIVFFHMKSKSLFMADAFWNYPESQLPNYFGVSDTGAIHECPKMPVGGLTSDTLPPIEVPLGTKLWKFGMDKVYLPFYKNLMVGKSGERRAKYEKAVAKVLSWNAEVIIPCHGDVIRGEKLCRKVLSEHFFG
jgi:hypothetical protein